MAVESRDVEAWFRELRKGNAQKRVKPLADPTIDKIRRIMSLVFKHAQRCNFLPRQHEGNPMNWVSQRTTSDYRAIVMTPQQAFEVLLNIPEPKRTLTLSDAATALRVSELLGLTWMDLDFGPLVISVRRAYVWERFKEPKSKASKAPVPMHPPLAGFLLAWRERTNYANWPGAKERTMPKTRFCVSQSKAARQEAAVRVHHGAEILAACSRPCRCDPCRLERTAFTTFAILSQLHW
jgi:integrase